MEPGGDGGAKIDLSNHIASYLGWTDLTSDTWRTERKFNVWKFPVDRTIPTRRVKLKFELPAIKGPATAR